MQWKFLMKNPSVKDSIPRKICIKSIVLERVNQFDFLISSLSYLEYLYVTNKILQTNKAVGILSNKSFSGPTTYSQALIM